MATYIEDESGCPFVYRVEAVTKVVDGDTLDCVFDLGFDVMVKPSCTNAWYRHT